MKQRMTNIAGKEYIYTTYILYIEGRIVVDMKYDDLCYIIVPTQVDKNVR